MRQTAVQQSLNLWEPWTWRLPQLHLHALLPLLLLLLAAAEAVKWPASVGCLQQSGQAQV